MKGFAMMTKLTNIGGRADYISNPKRQESILAKSAPVDWSEYSRYEASNQRTTTKNNEGREIVIALPNTWSSLSERELSRRAQSIAESAIGKSTDLQWAVHWNKAKTNLHLHVVFSERQREDQGVWDRDIYHTAEGKVARCKADRARLPDGSIAPPIHRKGEPKGGFTAKDHKYATRSWLHETKGRLRQHMTEKWSVRFDEAELLHEFHEGKGKEAPKIRKKNEAIRAINLEYSRLLADPAYDEKFIADFRLAALREVKRGCSGVIYPVGKQIGACDLDHWKKRAEGNAAAIARQKPQKCPRGLFGRAMARKYAHTEEKAVRERQNAVEAAQKARETASAAEEQRKAENHAQFEAVSRQMDRQRWAELNAPKKKEPQKERDAANTADQPKARSWAEWNRDIAASKAARPADPKKQKEKSKGKTAPEGR